MGVTVAVMTTAVIMMTVWRVSWIKRKKDGMRHKTVLPAMMVITYFNIPCSDDRSTIAAMTDQLLQQMWSKYSLISSSYCTTRKWHFPQKMLWQISKPSAWATKGNETLRQGVKLYKSNTEWVTPLCIFKVPTHAFYSVSTTLFYISFVGRTLHNRLCPLTAAHRWEECSAR